jgi:hypothetical protein
MDANGGPAEEVAVFLHSPFRGDSQPRQFKTLGQYETIQVQEGGRKNLDVAYLELSQCHRAKIFIGRKVGYAHSLRSKCH